MTEKQRVKKHQKVDFEQGTTKKKEKKSYTGVIIAVLIIILLAIAVMKLRTIGPQTSLELDSDTAALVNGEKITLEELNAQYDLVPEQLKSYVTKQSILEQLVNEKLLLQEAAKNSITVTDEQIEASINAVIEQNLLTRDEFEERIVSQGLTMDYVKNYYGKEILINTLLNQSLIENVISEADALAYYNENLEQYQTPERLRASHILLNSSEEAEMLIVRLQDGEDFGELAKEYSIGPSSIRGGDLGEFSRGMMVPAFEDAAFALEVGEITVHPVKTEFGYHIIKVFNRTGAQQTEFDQVKDQIMRQLEVEGQRDQLQGYLAELREKSDIKISTEEITASTKISFEDSGDSLCSVDEKPIIRMFSATTCPHCNWVKDTFIEAVQPYVNSGEIVAHLWEVDTGDDVLSDEVETGVPVEEIELFRKYNPPGGVPTFVFGCKYVRLGNAFETENDLAREKQEFQAVIEQLLS